jgi:hypothetical protein
VSSHTFTLTATCEDDGVVPTLCGTPPGGVHAFGAPTIAGAADFTINPVGNACLPGLLLTISFPSSSSCTTNVRFSPATPGLKTATLTLSGGPDIALTGTGLSSDPGGGAPGGGTPGVVGKKKKKCKKGKKKRSAASAKKKKCRKKRK